MHIQASPAAKRLTTNQLLECAKKIASARPQAFSVPEIMYNALLSALKRRTECTLWFEKQEQCTGNEDLQQSNATHGFFNSTLEAVHKLLQPFVESPSDPKSAPEKSRSATQAPANMFKSLAELSLTKDEADETPTPAPKSNRPVPLTSPEALYQLDSTGEALMAIYCLLEDFLELCVAVRSTWHNFAQETNCANEMVYVLANDFVEKFPQITTMDQIMVMLLVPSAHGAPGPHEPTASKKSPTADGAILLQTDHCKLVEILQHTYLETFEVAESSTKLAAISDGPLICSTEVSDEFMESFKKGEKAKTPLGNLESSIRCLSGIRGKSSLVRQELFPDADSFTRLWYDAIMQHPNVTKPGLEQMLVTQLFVDVQTIMLRFRGLLDHVDAIFKLIFDSDMACHDLHQEPRPEGESSTNMSLAAWPHVPGRDSPGTGDAAILMNLYAALNPTWIGLRLLYRLAGQKFYETGSINVQWAISATAHLQNALLKLRHFDTPNEPFIQEEWESLETAVQIIGHQKVFVASELPNTLKECATRCKLAMGAKAQDFAVNKRRNVKSKTRRPRETDITAPMLRAVLYNYQHKEVMGDFLINPYASNIMDAMIVFHQGSTSPQSTLQEVRDCMGALSLEQHLSIVCSTFQLNLSECTFAYAELGDVCSHILHEANAVLKDEFKKHRIFTPLPEEAYLMPLALLAQEEMNMSAAKKDTNASIILFPYIHRVAEVFEKYKAEYGGEKTDTMKAWCQTLQLPLPLGVETPAMGFGKGSNEVYQTMMTERPSAAHLRTLREEKMSSQPLELEGWMLK